MAAEARAGGLKAGQIRAHPALLVADPRSRLTGDPEVCVFSYGICGSMTPPDACSACYDRFGAERSRSKATIGRCWPRLRRRS